MHCIKHVIDLENFGPNPSSATYMLAMLYLHGKDRMHWPLVPLKSLTCFLHSPLAYLIRKHCNYVHLVRCIAGKWIHRYVKRIFLYLILILYNQF